ncbi:nucleotidyltransferase domain-containing protein [Desulfovirgula thermocuniculi]|uniref:nucleotidyltransferase domain-containing protein n=1 Tax=Desulfovirgula thermocuniculi TaxID=348842 RepID=UPI000429F3C9|nr:nucleotidyltransferase domain-containing protein [Desulfovirgula thermocuniculi]
MKERKRHLTSAEKRRIKAILKRELSKRPEIFFAYLHGSFLLPVPCGDVDVAVYLGKDATDLGTWEYEAELGASLEPLAGMPVDVLVLNRAPVALRYHATRGQVLYSRDEETRFTFLENTWREYFDYQPLLRAFLEDLVGSSGESAPAKNP